MYRKIHLSKSRLAMIVLFGLIALAITGSAAIAGSGCKKVEGKLTLEPLGGPECTSPVGLCAIGEYIGDISASSFFTGTSLVPTVDTPATGVVLLTGDNAIQTRKGALQTKDAIVLKTTGAGEFAEVDTIVAGSGVWTGATGTLQATGTFTSSGGEGSYMGEICTP